MTPQGDDTLPTSVTGLRMEICRHLAWVDIVGVTALSEACVEADADRPLSDSVARRLHHPCPGPDRNIVVLSTNPHGQDRVVGYAHLGPAPDAPGSSTEIAVHPAFRGRGIARLLLRTVLDETPDGRLRLVAPHPTPITRALARSAGLTSARRRDHLVLGPSTRPRACPPVNGVRIRAFVADQDETAWQSLRTQLRHSRPQADVWTVADLRRSGQGSWFDPEGLLVAENTTDAEQTQLLGFAWATVHQDGRPRDVRGRAEPVTGHLHLGEVIPSANAPMIGWALADSAMRWLNARGVATVVTSTDDQSGGPAGMLRQLGFRDHHMDTVFSFRNDRPSSPARPWRDRAFTDSSPPFEQPTRQATSWETNTVGGAVAEYSDP